MGLAQGSDSFSLEVTDKLADRKVKAPSVKSYIERREEIDYARYARYRKKIRM